MAKLLGRPSIIACISSLDYTHKHRTILSSPTGSAYCAMKLSLSHWAFVRDKNVLKPRSSRYDKRAVFLLLHTNCQRSAQGEMAGQVDAHLLRNLTNASHDKDKEYFPNNPNNKTFDS